MGRIRVVLCAAAVLLAGMSAFGQAGRVDVPLNGSVVVTTVAGVALPTSFGGPDSFYAVLRLGPLAAGARVEFTLTFDAGTDMGWAAAWVDGDPAGKDWGTLLGTGTGTGTREMKGKEAKSLFSVAPASTSNVLFLVLRSARPWTVKAALTDRLSGATPNTQDRWGYYYVDDFDTSRYSPFLLTRGGTWSGSAGQGAAPPAAARTGYVDVPVNSTVRIRTVTGVGLHSSFGGPEYFYTVCRLLPLAPGKRYEVTLTYDAGTDMGWATAWVDGDPGGRDWASFVGTGTGTGTREMKGKESKYIFSVDPKSTTAVLYLAIRSHRQWDLSVGLTDRLSGATPSTQDRWGYTYVDDFDASRTSPFLLQRDAGR